MGLGLKISLLQMTPLRKDLQNSIQIEVVESFLIYKFLPTLLRLTFLLFRTVDKKNYKNDIRMACLCVENYNTKI